MKLKKIHFTFLDDFITYDCGECKGVCCYVNNNLVVDTYSAVKIENSYTPLSAFISKIGDTSVLNCGKKCWFLSDKGCIIKDLGISKPPTCSLYPLQILSTREYLIVSYISCPVYRLGSSKYSIKYEDSISIINQYINTGAPLRELSPNISNERIEEEVTYQENFKSSVLLKMFQENSGLDYNKKFNYYLGIRWNKKIMSVPIKRTLDYWDIYKKVCKELEKTFNFLDESNIIHIITDQFLNQIENHKTLRLIR
ncbi:MAG TPA: hypothetical protein VGC17_01760 [Lactovum miscens]|uniref:hypothetical protein n=1 Tax=Lactovum miscens TaxID=190387 RepID=UPI002EDAF902